LRTVCYGFAIPPESIIENYAQFVECKDLKTGKVKRDQLFPRFHQLDVVRKLLADAKAKGAGRRVPIQHSAGSGKSNSIAWLAHQLVRLANDTGQVFDSVIVVTDRRILDQQIKDTIKQFAQVGATVGHAEHSGDLRRFITDGKKIIITTVQKFPFILDDIGAQHKDRRFAPEPNPESGKKDVVWFALIGVPPTIETAANIKSP
jgi:type I restriction enzyme, R subunit